MNFLTSKLYRRYGWLLYVIIVSIAYWIYYSINKESLNFDNYDKLISYCSSFLISLFMFMVLLDLRNIESDNLNYKSAHLASFLTVSTTFTIWTIYIYCFIDHSNFYPLILNLVVIFGLMKYFIPRTHSILDYKDKTLDKYFPLQVWNYYYYYSRESVLKSDLNKFNKSSITFNELYKIKKSISDQSKEDLKSLLSLINLSKHTQIFK